MGCSFQFDPTNNILRYDWEGPLTDETLVEGDATARKLLAIRPPCRGLLDFSKVTAIEVSTKTIQRIASQPPAYGSDQAVVLVTPQDLIFGLSRMFVLLKEGKRPRMSVVHTMAEAYALLGVKSEQFIPIFAT